MTNELVNIPLYNQKHSIANINDPLLQLLTFENVSTFQIWEGIGKFKNISAVEIPSHLQTLAEIPVENLFVIGTRYDSVSGALREEISQPDSCSNNNSYLNDVLFSINEHTCERMRVYYC